MQKENKLFFVPLVGNNLQPRKVGIRGSACRQKEGLKPIKDLPLLPRLTAVLPPRGREIHRGFTPYCHPELDSGSRRCSIKGFTLIELLVVVLIIGILAAIALPQYQKAVEKARAAKFLPILNQVYLAQKRHFLEHGTYATAWDQLDVDFTSFGKYTPGDGVINGPHNSQLRLSESAVWIYTNTKIGSYLGYYYSGPWSELKWCRADPANSLSVHVCKSLTGRSTHTSGSVESGVFQYTFPESKNF